MKKFKKILLTLLRLSIMFAPGIGVAIWLRGVHGWPVSVLAGLGVILIVSLAITFLSVLLGQVRGRIKTRI